MTEQHVKIALMHLCKPSVLDSDFNVVAFHALCDRLKEIGAAEEREACAKICDFEWGTGSEKDAGIMFAAVIRARGSK
jgi:hypothetical protein